VKIATNKTEAVGEPAVGGDRSGVHLVQDEPVPVMGSGKGPTPKDLFISSVATCENEILVRNAALNGLPVDSLETVAEGTWNIKGLYEMDGAEPSLFDLLVSEGRIENQEAGFLRKAKKAVAMTKMTSSPTTA
jgi:hypothetical protein